MNPTTTTTTTTTIPAPVSESSLWACARDILYFVGVNGAGKTTLAHMLADRCRAFGGEVILDAEERAFDRRFMGCRDAETHRQIVEHSIALINDWKRSSANLVIVDRWYETYISECGLPMTCVDQIEAALLDSGFKVTVINLNIGRDVRIDDFETMLARLAHTKGNRPDDWWDATRGSLEERARADCGHQAGNRDFCSRAPFASSTIATADMRWDDYVQGIVETLANERRWRDFNTDDAKAFLGLIVGQKPEIDGWKQRATAHFAYKYGLSLELATTAAEHAWSHSLERHGGDVTGALALDAEILNYNWINSCGKR